MNAGPPEPPAVGASRNGQPSVGGLPLEPVEGRAVSEQTAVEVDEAPSSSPILSVSEVSVSFGGIRALDGVSV